MEFRVQRMSSTPRPTSVTKAAPATEVRCAVRFPLRLPIKVSSGKKEYLAVTENISANGVLFELDDALEVGSAVELEMNMPAAVLGTPTDVVVQCVGRVVRSYPSPPGAHAAAVIDEYRFKD